MTEINAKQSLGLLPRHNFLPQPEAVIYLHEEENKMPNNVSAD